MPPTPPKFFELLGHFFESQNFCNFLALLCVLVHPIFGQKVPKNFWIWSTTHPPFLPIIPKMFMHKKCSKTFGLLWNPAPPPPPLWKKKPQTKAAVFLGEATFSLPKFSGFFSYWSYYPQTLTDSVSLLCRIFFSQHIPNNLCTLLKFVFT